MRVSTLPMWPGPHLPPPLVANSYPPLVPSPRVASARRDDDCRREAHQPRGRPMAFERRLNSLQLA